jgi:hypothetical protein
MSTELSIEARQQIEMQIQAGYRVASNVSIDVTLLPRITWLRIENVQSVTHYCIDDENNTPLSRWDAFALVRFLQRHHQAQDSKRYRSRGVYR